MILAHRIALDPTVEQSIALARACGCARFTWNWALAEWDKQYKAGEKPTANKLKLLWNKLKHEAFPWILESPKDANQQPFANLGKAFNRFFKKKAKRPRFKRKGVHDSFYLSNDKFSVEDMTVRLPVIGPVRMTEALRFEGKIMSGTVSREAQRWYLSVQVEVGEVQKPRIASGQVGIDLGVKTALVLSNGQTFEAPKPLRAGLRKLKHLSKAHSRKRKGSQNRKKSARRLARHHARIKAIRRDWTHKVTTQVCRENQTIVLEDLNVKGMTANHCLARAINDVGFHEIRRQFEYKAPMYGSKVIVIDRWMPTSKTCSKCGHKKDVLALSERIFTCDCCGYSGDRDLNAAKSILAAGLAVTACGPEGSGLRRKTKTKPCRDEAGNTPVGELTFAHKV
jgi:putative transposase